MATTLKTACLLLCFSLGIVCGFEWENKPDAFVYACPGSKAFFPWRYKTRGAEVVGMNWLHDDAFSSNVIASSVRGQFTVTMETFSGRAHELSNGGLSVSDVRVGDSGNYTLEVNVNEGGLYRTYRHTVYLQVPEGLMVKGGRVKGEQESSARLEESSQQWRLRLTCGVFTFLGQPSIDVLWTLPSGEKVISSGYDSGLFYLSLPSPVPGGVYTCAVPPVSYSSICFTLPPDGNGSAVMASVTIDDTRARLSQLEANQKAMRQENAELRERLQSVEQKLTADVVDRFGVIKSDLSQEIADLKSAQQTLQRNMQALLNWTEVAATIGPCRPDNYTTLNDSQRLTTVRLDNSNNNNGNGSEAIIMCDHRLEETWYRLVHDQANAVMPTTCPPTHRCSTHAPTWLDLRGHALPKIGQELDARACSHWSDNCCHWEAAIRVRNCGDYFVYRLSPLSACNLAYCMEPQH